ncbi:hypothetical protein KGA66_21050 [Actinocrinis puniceicyclus]|uniref:Uncharacterized protein n=1 Tax=Actinocrinis puniceicyclus TaxID=977794 RepID=A0A8J7WNB0_9ACTN|nr:hypothetical protein [Actinocrinis puniceicyclus]MBS2965551.1 hypothetical protein [Actinocrinis puniceicyclus]
MDCGPAVEQRMTLPPDTSVDAAADWICAAARRLVPLSANTHAAVHAVGGGIALDLVTNGVPPLTLSVRLRRHELSICAKDARIYTEADADAIPPDLDEIRFLSSRLYLGGVPGSPGRTLIAAIRLNRARHQPIRAIVQRHSQEP